MPVAPQLLAALEAALTADPDQVPVRLHLAGLLLDDGQAAAALEHAGQVLARQPDSLQALRIAARAAADCGQLERAAAYRRLLDALAPADGTDAGSGAEGPGGVPGTAAGADELPGESEDQAEPGDAETHGRVVPLRALAGGGRGGGVPDDLERPEVTLADVGGMEQVKRRLQTAFLGPMRNPQLRS